MKNLFDNGFYESQQLKKIGFKKIGKNVQISKNCLIVGIKNILSEGIYAGIPCKKLKK